MTLEEAIKHAEEVAEENQAIADASVHYGFNTAEKCEKCAEEHRQLAEWLKDYKRLLEQEPKTGHWILGGYDDNYYICDKCNYKASEYYFKPRYSFCPNCGARMIESQESEE